MFCMVVWICLSTIRENRYMATVARSAANQSMHGVAEKDGLSTSCRLAFYALMEALGVLDYP